MSTQTQIINAQSIGTGTNITVSDVPLFPTKLSLQSTTTAFTVTGKITNGNSRYGVKQQVRLWYSTSPISFAATAALIIQLRMTARPLDLYQGQLPLEVRTTDSQLESVTGPYLYLWADVPLHTVAQTLDVYVNELP